MQSITPFIVTSFNKAETNLSLLIREVFGAEFPDIDNKRQIKYLISYLNGLDTQTIICETNYIDKDYIADFQKYFATCYSNYPKTTARLHFFKTKFSTDDFENWVTTGEGEKIEILRKNYLGYIVIKPLPVTFLGKTCLKHYPNRVGKKLITKTYIANLFGIELEVDSIAYQEQDKVVSACATTALWSLMHATGHISCKNVPSPSEITLSAIKSDSSNINAFPNNGLSDVQILAAMEEYRLKRHDFNIKNEHSLSLKNINEYISEHLDSEVPILAGVTVYQKNDGKDWVEKGKHAITLLGYAKDKNNRLDTIYIHDDRIGPYVKAKLIKTGFKSFTESGDEDTSTPNLSFHYQLEIKGYDIDEKITLDNIKTGHYHKIRVPFTRIKEACLRIENLASVAFSRGSKVSSEEKEKTTSGVIISHKVELKKSTELKKDILGKDLIVNNKEILFTNLPHYVWKGTFFINIEKKSIPILDLIYDTTDIPLGNELIKIIKHEPFYNEFLQMLSDIYRSYPKPQRNTENISESFFLSTLRYIAQTKPANLSEALDGQYGPLRLPKKLDPSEIINSNPVNHPHKEYLFRDSSNLLEDNFKQEKTNKLIWVISKEGTLHIGADKGHPTLTGATSARIAGEVIKLGGKRYQINGKSGRYSTNYLQKDSNLYLYNALNKFCALFPEEEFRLELFDSKRKKVIGLVYPNKKLSRWQQRNVWR